MRRILLFATVVALFATGTAHAVPVEVERSAEKEQAWCMARTTPDDRAGLAGARAYAPAFNVTDRPYTLLKCARVERRVVTKRWTEIVHVAPEPEPVPVYVAESALPPEPIYEGGSYAIPEHIVQCESGGDYNAVNPSSGARGAYQILPSTHAAHNCAGWSPAEQDECAARIWESQGSSAWVC